MGNFGYYNASNKELNERGIIIHGVLGEVKKDKEKSLFEKAGTLWVPVDLLVDKPGFEYEEFTNGKSYRIVTQRIEVNKEKSRAGYHVSLFNEDLAAGRESSQKPLLDMPGYVEAHSGGYTSLSEAMSVHRGLLRFLNQRGY